VKLLADEGVDAQIVAHLGAAGHDVTYVAELAPGVTDEAVLELANVQNRVLLTADKDFGELVFRLGRLPRGVVLLRLAGMGLESRAEVVLHATTDHCDQMDGAFTVISPGQLRIRLRGTD